MSPGPAEEAGKAVSGIIEALRQQPALLVMAIVNVLLVGFMFYIAQLVSKQREREVAQIYAAQKQVQDLLTRCSCRPEEEK